MIMLTKPHCYFHSQDRENVGRNSSVGIATRYGFDQPGVEFQQGNEIFCRRPDWFWAHPDSYIMGTGLFQGLNQPGVGVNHPNQRKCRVLSLLPIWTFRAGLHFTVLFEDSVKSDTDCCNLTEDTPYNLLSSSCRECLTFRHRASSIQGQAFHYSPENAFYIFNQQIYFII